MTRRTPERPRFVAGSMGPTGRTASISPSVDDPAARNISFDELARNLSDSGRGPDRWRSRSAARRNHFRHPQCQGRNLCDSEGHGIPQNPDSADALRNSQRCERTHACRAVRRGISHFGSSCGGASERRIQLRARRGRDASASGGAGFQGVVPGQRPSECGTAQQLRRSTSRHRNRWDA